MHSKFSQGLLDSVSFLKFVFLYFDGSNKINNNGNK